MTKTINYSQEQEILNNFIELVQTPYGNFSAIGKLYSNINNNSIQKKIIESLSQTEQGEEALREQPCLGRVDLEKLEGLPAQTLGYQYARHMITNELIPPLIENELKEPYVFVGQHLLETHDIWHVVTGSNTDKPGEIQLEAFYCAQLNWHGLYPALLAKNLLKTAMYEMELSEQIMEALVRGWRMGKEAKALFGIQWNQLWEKPLEEIRASLEIKLV